MLTKKGKYGLKALVYLSRIPVGQLAFVGDIATRNNIPKKFLDAILGELRNAGFVQSRKGKEGGYRLARPASEIKIGHVVRVLDGTARPDLMRQSDALPALRRLRRGDVRGAAHDAGSAHAIAEVLDNRSLAAMRDAANDDVLTELVQNL